MRNTTQPKRAGNGKLVKLFQQLAMLFESPEKKQFRRLKEFLAA